jgi:4-hydroxybenzoate polyprenyltransferase
MRSAGCAINDYADRHVDGHVARTQHRPLVAGLLPARYALYWALGLALMALLLVVPLGPKVLAMCLPAAFLAASYPYTKRFFPLPQAYLGLAFGFGIPMAFIAIQGSVPLAAWCLFAANVAWTIAYDTQYAMVDKPDDLKIGIHTSAIFFERYDTLAVLFFNGLALGLWLVVAHALALHPAFFLGWAIALVLVCVHHQWLKTGQPVLYFRAFLHNNWVGAALFGGVCLGVFLKV